MTDQFRARSEGARDPAYQLIIRVINNKPAYTGLICYMSYDYGDLEEFRYTLNTSEPNQWYFVSMPIFAYPAGRTLAQLFPGIDSAKIYDTEADSWRYIDINRPLTGAFGDTMRAYSFGMRYPSEGEHLARIRGFPIFEQRYLDFNSDNLLYFGSVCCEIPFLGYEPNDSPDGKIRGDLTYQFGGFPPTWNNPTEIVKPKYGHYTVPDTFFDPRDIWSIRFPMGLTYIATVMDYRLVLVG